MLPLSFNSNLVDNMNVCTDSGCGMSIIDRRLVPKDAEVKTMLKIPLREIGDNVYYTNKFKVVTFYLQGREAIAKITREIHLVDSLQANMLIRADIFTSKGITLDYQN